MKVRLTTLAENTTASPALLVELGLSIVIETGPSCVLLDAGQTGSATHNAGIGPYARAAPESPPWSLGGSQLVGAGEERISKTIAAIKALGVGRLGLCHCTNLPAAAKIAHAFGDAFFFNVPGNRTEIEVGQ